MRVLYLEFFGVLCRAHLPVVLFNLAEKNRGLKTIYKLKFTGPSESRPPKTLIYLISNGFTMKNNEKKKENK